MIPSPWVGLVLALGAFRIARIIGWDDLPIIVKARDWVTGTQVVKSGSSAALANLSSEQAEFELYHERPVVAKFISCPWCQGFYVSIAVYVAWIFEPTWTVYVLAPFALSAFVGLVAKNLDP
jgi:hypothetical protein